MPDPTRSDETLMEALRGSDPAAFDVLYQRYHGVVFNFLLRMVRDRALAEDLLQETFLRLFAHRAGYRRTARFKTWVLTIARNLAIDRLRRVGEFSPPESNEALEALPDRRANPLQRAEAAELADRLQAALLRLPSSQREVLLLSRFAGLSHEEIADVIETSPGAVRVTLHRALRRLQALLEL